MNHLVSALSCQCLELYVVFCWIRQGAQEIERLNELGILRKIFEEFKVRRSLLCVDYLCSRLAIKYLPSAATNPISISDTFAYIAHLHIYIVEGIWAQASMTNSVEDYYKSTSVRYREADRNFGLVTI